MRGMFLILALILLAAPSFAGRDATLNPAPAMDSPPVTEVVFGNCAFDECCGCYGAWWRGFESYALHVDPLEQGYAYTPGTSEFYVYNINMRLWLDSSCNLTVQAHLYKGNDVDSDGFYEPDYVYASSAPVVVSGIEGRFVCTDVSIPCDFGPVPLFRQYFLVFEFLDAAADYCGMPICSDCEPGELYNNESGDWVDLIGDSGLIGTMYIWAEIELLDGAIPNAEATWGEVKALYR